MPRRPRIDRTVTRAKPVERHVALHRQAGRDHLAYVRALPCCSCGRSPSIAAHYRRGQHAPMQGKPEDRYTVPLCRDCHQRQHDVGEVTFWRDSEIPLGLADSLWRHTGDIDRGQRLVHHAWRRLAVVRAAANREGK